MGSTGEGETGGCQIPDAGGEESGDWVRGRLGGGEARNAEVGPGVVMLIAELCRGYRCRSRKIKSAFIAIKRYKTLTYFLTTNFIFAYKQK
jgi:hypothetical protein